MTIAIKEIEAERASFQGDEEFQMLTPHIHTTDTDDTSYRGLDTTVPYPYKAALNRAK